MGFTIVPVFRLGHPTYMYLKKKSGSATAHNQTNQSLIINQFHSSGGAVLLQVLPVTCFSTVVDDSREQQRWRCFGSRAQTHTR